MGITYNASTMIYKRLFTLAGKHFIPYTELVAQLHHKNRHVLITLPLPFVRVPQSTLLCGGT